MVIKQQAKSDRSVRYLKGVGPHLAEILERLGVKTLEDLVYFFPRNYQDRTRIGNIANLASGEVGLVVGIVKSVVIEKKQKGVTLIRAMLSDASGEILEALWFNQPYLLSFLKRGTQLFLLGKVSFNSYRGALEMLVKEYEKVEGDRKSWEKIVPIYPLTEGLYQKRLRTIIDAALSVYLPDLLDYLPKELIKEEDFPDLILAISRMHKPKELKLVAPSRKRLVFDDFFVFQLGLLLMKHKREKPLTGINYRTEIDLLKSFENSLPFKLTASQQEVIVQIKKDMALSIPMSRLLQGDVGSGKTIVAIFSALIAVANGYQAVIMAPTEILARQHYHKIKNYLAGFKLKTEILTGSTKAKDKKVILGKISKGEAQIIIGTHALIEEGVGFAKLGLVVIDEQHRFGVRQREFMRNKGQSPDLLVMSATPIPRTLALTLYGDLERSVILELPPGRLPVKTHYVPESKRKASYEFIRKEISRGRQVFVVCPLIEESESLSVKAALVEGEVLQKNVFPEFKVAVMHGRLKAVEKNKLMQDFKNNEIQVLVSTSVIEVGIDIPNAAIMVIEQVERFGLSALHQLRGRIGRGSQQSWCFLFGEIKTEDAKQRISALIASNNGFCIAEADLKIRGPGDFFGVRQAGLPPFRVADIITDEDILRLAREKALGLIKTDPGLDKPEHSLLKQEILKRLNKTCE